MIILTQVLPPGEVRVDATVSLPVAQRSRSRLKVKLDDGRDAGFFLPRGRLLRDGDLLGGDDGVIVRVIAATEKVSTVLSQDPTALAKAAYHLGNRHVPLQVARGWLRYQHDHVLDAMLAQMGLEVRVEKQPFEPEAGAYQPLDGAAHHHG